MKGHRPVVRAWIYFVALAAVLVTAARSADGVPSLNHWEAFALLAGSAALAHRFPIRSSGDASYRLTSAFVFGGAVVLPAPLVTLLAVSAITPDSWLRRHKPGEINRWLFNVGQAALVAHVAALCLARVGGDGVLELDEPRHVIALAAAGGVFTLLQSLLVGIAISLQSKIPLHRADTLTPTALLSDGLVALQGMIFAGLWLAKPLLVVIFPALILAAHRLTQKAHLAQVAQLDPKTGLHNARYFDEALRGELEHSRRLGRPLSLLFVDLDHFKRVNDEHGHSAGDMVLREVATLLGGLVRKGDIVARFGGEEFVLLLPGTEINEATRLAERARQAVETHPITLPSEVQVKCTASIGLASFPLHASTERELLDAADAAMYVAKRTRNVVARPDSAGALPQSVRAPEPRAVPADSMVSDAQRDAQRDAVAARDGAAATASLPSATQRAAAAAPTGAASRPGRAAQAALWVSVGGSVVVGVVSALLLLLGTTDWLVVFFFAAAATAAELLKVDVYHSGRQRISLSLTVLVTMAAVTFAPPVAPLVSFTAACVHVATAWRRLTPAKAAFNLANPVLAAGAASGIYAVLHGILPTHGHWQLLAGAAAVLGFYAVNVGSISLMVWLHTGRRLAEVLRGASWFAPMNLLLGLTGAFLGQSHVRLGHDGIILFAIPVVVLRYALTLYARNTEETIGALQTINARAEAANAEKEALLGRLIETVARIIDVRDNSVSGHSRRVAKYATAIGASLGISGDELATLHAAGLLHDLGKVGVPEVLLHKPARLTDDEYEVVKRHADIGEHLLADVPQLAHVARMIGQHHERFDGTGYPHRIEGKRISIGGRILAVADALETMLTHRPYSRARDLTDAIAELNRCAGTHFDPEVVDAVHRIIGEYGASFFTDPVAPLSRSDNPDVSDAPDPLAVRSGGSDDERAAKRLLQQVFRATDPG